MYVHFLAKIKKKGKISLVVSQVSTVWEISRLDFRKMSLLSQSFKALHTGLD